MGNDEIEAKIVAQKLYVTKTKAPLFAPIDGICWSCKRQIYNAMSLEAAGKHHITGCPYCHRSYCD